MLNMRKLIPFALAAGMMGGSAAANDEDYTVSYEKPDGSPFSCVQEVVRAPEGIYRFAHKCPNTAGSVLIANHALARMDWARAFAENEKLLSRGISERPVIDGLLKSALMRGQLDKAVWAANVAAVEGVVTPYSALINAARAARQNDVLGAFSELMDLPVDNGDPVSLYVNNLAYTLEVAMGKAAPGAKKNDGAALFAQALADTDAMIQEQVQQAIARDGADSAPAYAEFSEVSTMLRRGAELLINPADYEARRALVKFYIGKDAVEAGAEMLDGIPDSLQTQEDRGMAQFLRRGLPPMSPTVLPPIPTHAPR